MQVHTFILVPSETMFYLRTHLRFWAKFSEELNIFEKDYGNIFYTKNGENITTC